VACKKTLIKALNDLLEPMRERRRKYEANPDLVTQILQAGTKRARELGQATLADVRRAMKIDYF
jgi:tryptophanyl-tRNA synthetase